jgi:membrane-bound lytic murein transglycosylase A
MPSAPHRLPCRAATKNPRIRCLSPFLLFTLAGVLACCPVPLKEASSPEEALGEIRFFLPFFRDDSDRGSLILAIRRNIASLSRLPPGTVFSYGVHRFTLPEVREGQEKFLTLLEKSIDDEQLTREVRENFRIYRAAGRVGGRKVLFTGYYEPVYDGSLIPDEIFRYPLYRTPADLFKIDLSPFGDKFKGEALTARMEAGRIVPYYSRNEIEKERMLDGKGLEIAWLRDPLDVAFLQIQGSGRIRLPDGKYLLVQYHASNGRPYRSIGSYMIEKGFLTREEMSMQAIRKYLSSNPHRTEEVLSSNPSYVFFREAEDGPRGSLGALLTPGRSVALDPKLFPKGALGFISTRRPVVDDRGEITGWTEFSRFVLNQDSGGAIKGPGRADLFWGAGPYAELAAGHSKEDGELYILIKKP